MSAASAARSREPVAGTRTGTRLGRRRIYILPTRQGVGFAGLLLVMLVGSVNYSNGLGFVLTFALGSLALVSILHTYANLAGLVLRPAAAQPAFAGDPLTFEVVVDNPERRTRHAILARYRSAPHVRGAGDRVVETDLAAGAATRLALVAEPGTRGWCTLARVTLATRFPLGLFRAWSPVDLELRCLVYPRPAGDLPLPEAGASTRREGSGSGGGREDFAGLREYRAGDPPRQIHWKAVAREQGVPVKLFAGSGADEVLLGLEQAGTGDIEARLGQLARWVLDAERRGMRYALALPGVALDAAQGEAHRDACLRALALHPAGPGAPVTP